MVEVSSLFGVTQAEPQSESELEWPPRRGSDSDKPVAAREGMRMPSIWGLGTGARRTACGEEAGQADTREGQLLWQSRHLGRERARLALLSGREADGQVN